MQMVLSENVWTNVIAIVIVIVIIWTNVIAIVIVWTNVIAIVIVIDYIAILFIRNRNRACDK